MTAEVPGAVQEGGDAQGILSRRRLYLILAVLLVEFALFFAGLLTPLSAADRQSLANQTSSQFGGVSTGSSLQLVGFIFTHNVAIAIPEMIPVAGALLFAVSVYSTGVAAQALVSSQGLPPQWGAVIFAFPYSLVELTAYAVAVASGVMLIVAWRRKKLRKELRAFALEGLAVVVILLTAAAMEAATVKVSAALGFGLWIPTVIALVVGAVVVGRKTRA